MDDRRSYQRYTVSLEVRLRDSAAAPDASDATIVDVSFGGLGIVSSRNILPGTEVLVEWPDPPFYFAGDAVAPCVVVDAGEDEENTGLFRLRVKFRDADSELAQSLLNWVQMQANRQKMSQFSGPRADQRKRVRF